MTDRIAAFRDKTLKEGLDAFLVYSDVNRNYLSRFTGTSGAVLLTPKGSLFVTDSRYTLQAQRQVKHAKLHLQTQSLLVELAGLLKRSGAKRIGFEAGHMTVAQHQWLLTKLPKAKLLPTRGLVEGLRLTKDGQEQEAMRVAARITDRTIHHILAFIRPGVSENELAAEMEHFMRRQGAEGPSFETIVASGWRSALPHGVASAKRVEKGDFIVIDFGCRLNGYCSDMTRTVCVGPPSALQKKVYGIVQRAQAAGLKAIKAGKTAGDVDAACRRLIVKAGYGRRFGHGTGHGVGQEVHEDPRVGPKAPDVLKPGMAITVEPGIYLDGKFGVRIEDLAFVTQQGHENLYRTTKELIVV
jgi:Xaa-Pro aminopeptidase